MGTNLNWTLTQLKNELSKRKEIKGWGITQENTHRRERYFMQEGGALVVDQDREIHGQTIALNLFVNLPEKPGRQGEITKKLFPSMPLREQIDSAIESAVQTDHEAWDLPTELAKNLPSLRTTDPRIAEDVEGVMQDLTQRISVLVSQPRKTTFNSAEVFLSIHHRELHLSNGFTHRSSQSRIYTEAAFSFLKKDAQGLTYSDEYLNTRWSVNLDDLNLENLFEETSHRAQNSLDTIKPLTGKYAVIIDADVLATLFNTQITQLVAKNAYHGLPFIKPGDELVPGAIGDPITVTLDPSLDYGADTTAISDSGISQTPTPVVVNNLVTLTPTDQRYAQYLKLSPSTTRGTLVVNPGTLSHDELTRSAPQVLEILQFSALFMEPHSGTFSSEIRLARLYDREKGTVTSIKGGSLSGSFNENFRNARFSKTCVKRALFSSHSAGENLGEGYFGPEFALLADISIVG